MEIRACLIMSLVAITSHAADTSEWKKSLESRPAFGLWLVAYDKGGPVVHETCKGGFLDAATVSKGDQIIALNGWKVVTEDELSAAIQTMKVGESVEVVVRRSGKTHRFSAEVPSRTDYVQAQILADEPDKVTLRTTLSHVRAPFGKIAAGLSAGFDQDELGNPGVLFVVLGAKSERPFTFTEVVVRAGTFVATFPTDDVSTRFDLRESSAWALLPARGDLLDALCALCEHGSGIIRFRGNRIIDVEIEQDQVSALSDVLLAFKLRGGELSDEKLAWAVKRREVKSVSLVRFGDKPAESRTAISDDSRHESAARKLNLAKRFLDKDRATATRRLIEVIDEFDGTPAAVEARELLEKLK